MFLSLRSLSRHFSCCLPTHVKSTVFAMLCLLTATAAKTQTPSFKIIPESEQDLYAPFAGLEAFADWQLAVVNRSPGFMPITITIYSREGSVATKKAMTLDPSAVKVLDVKTLFEKALVPSDIGGVGIHFGGQTLGVGAQITLSGHKGYGNIDAPVIVDSFLRSSTADAVWLRPHHARSFLILGNSSDQAFTVDIAHPGEDAAKVSLMPHATVVRQLGRDTENDDKIDSVHVVGTGLPGTLRVTGYVVSDTNGFINTIRSFDPALSTEPAVYANGAHFSEGHNRLVVKNTSQQTVKAWGTIFPLASKSSPVAINPRDIPPGAEAQLEVPQPNGDTTLDGAAIKVESNGQASSVIANFTNNNEARHLTRSSPFKDISALLNSTGAYPWRIEASFTSKVFITNMGKTRAAIGAEIFPANGPTYQPETQYLEVGETAIFDLKELRDNRTPDSKGVTLPKDATYGQFRWSTMFGDGTQRLLGRNELLNTDSGLSASFSCPACNCPDSTTAAFLSPANIDTYVNGTFGGLLSNATQTHTCGGGSVTFSFAPSSWKVDSPSILSLSAGQLKTTLKGLSGGDSSYYTPFTGISYQFNGGTGSCFVAYQPVLNPAGNGEVQYPTAYVYAGQQSDVPYNSCPTGQAGWTRIINRDVVDQHNKSIYQVFSLTETISVNPANNGLNLGFPTIGAPSTGGDGQGSDAFRFCSSKCPAGNQTTIFNQNISGTTGGTNWPLGNYTLIYSCSSPGTTMNGN